MTTEASKQFVLLMEKEVKRLKRSKEEEQK